MAKQVNRKQLEEIGEIWYNRAKKLMDYYQNENNPQEKRDKAFKLCYYMNARLVMIANAIWQLNTIDTLKFVRGGI